MNKTCARCDKTVYPTEELKCLDKVWHKGCFKCQECGMTLNMRTYKGYGKLPYCEAHVPKAKHTTMAETPELRRIAENTKIQSNVKYHADFEKSKGKFTQVADDPETLRIKANTKIISNVAYHGDLEKKAQMEKQRTLNENGDIVELPTPDNYQQQIDNYANEMLHQTQTQTQTRIPREYQDNRPKEPECYPQYQQKFDDNQHYNQQYLLSQQKAARIGRIQDYDPLSDGPRAVPNTQRTSSTLIYNSTSDGKQRGAHQSTQQHHRVIGRVTDMDPMANEVQHKPVPLPSTNTHINGVVYVALYDYEANDTDEVSFMEGDYISNVSSIDEGWMTGQVLRTGRTGMLPANYVQLMRN